MAKKSEKRRISPEPEQSNRERVMLSKSEQRAQLYVRGAIAAIALAVVGVIAVGIINSTVIVPKKTIAEVNGSVVTVDDYEKRVRLSYFIAAQRAGAAGGHNAGAQPQINTRLLGENILDRVVGDILIIQLAEEMGITASEQEIDQEIRDTVDPSVVAALSDPIDASEDGTTESGPTPTSTFVYTLTPVSDGEDGEQTHSADGTPSPEDIAVAADGSQDNADVTPDAASPTLLPQSTPSGPTEAQVDLLYRQQINTWMDVSGMNESEVRELFRIQILSEKLIDVLPLDIDTTEVQVLFGHIQLAEQEEAEALLESIRAGEQEFEIAAAENSLDTTTSYRGGETGWVTRAQIEGGVGNDFANIIFTLQPGEVGGPVLSPQGFHLIKVFDRQEAELPEFALTQEEQLALQLYLAEVRLDASIDVDENWENYIPALP